MKQINKQTPSVKFGLPIVQCLVIDSSSLIHNDFGFLGSLIFVHHLEESRTHLYGL